MSTKHNSTCLQKAGDNEPIFVLRAQDVFAPSIIRLWAEMAKQNPKITGTKIKSALDLADEMELWATRKLPD